jgi:ferredoxin
MSKSKVPVLDLGQCTDCEGCLAACSEVFRRNEAGYIEVLELDAYPEECIEEAMRCCPAQCISWEETP